MTLVIGILLGTALTWATVFVLSLLDRNPEATVYKFPEGTVIPPYPVFNKKFEEKDPAEKPVPKRIVSDPDTGERVELFD